MPIEVRELVIKVTLENQNAAQPQTQQDMAGDRQMLVADCVEQVMDILRQKETR